MYCGMMTCSGRLSRLMRSHLKRTPVRLIETYLTIHQMMTKVSILTKTTCVNIGSTFWRGTRLTPSCNAMSESQRSILVSRQRAHRDPFVFCIPLRGRRETADEEHFTFDDAITELKDIIQSSDEGTRQASNINSDDKEGKAAWWAERKRLDQRMKELLFV